MRELVFPQILRQSEDLAAELTRKRLLATVYVIMSLKRKLGCEALVTLWELALVDSSWIVSLFFLMSGLDHILQVDWKIMNVVF